MDRDPRSRILTIPNVISLARLLAVGWFLWLLLAEDRVVAAAIVFLVIGSTDWVDGTLARALNQETELGRLLDPIADRVALVAAVIGGTIAGIVPLTITVLLVAREVVMALAAAWFLRRTGETLHVRWLGKAATFLLYGAVPSFYLGAMEVAGDLFTLLGWVAGTVGLALYGWVAIGYLGEMRARSRVDASKEEAT
ncbi:MAG: CDP-alcohol phosphatidyltransferase family protein [Acidimicrobiia bacterium]|jgi:cardiolipin synthase|nr:MAG: CDP-alcohol phosphatidyltransferase family protein [Acidimicrobiia bacterium]